MNATLRAAREKAGLTQKQVAKTVGITEQTYQRYEYGTQKPNAYAAAKLAQALHSTVEELFPTASDDNRDTRQS